MRLNVVLIATTVLAGLFGLGFLFLPNQMLSLYGMQTDASGIWMGRYFGLTMVGIAAVAWVLRGVQDGQLQRQIAMAFLGFELLGLLVSLWGVFSPEGTSMVWLSVVIYGLLAAGYALVVMGVGAAVSTPAARARR